MDVWTKHRLHKLVLEHLADIKLIAVSNREPYIHTESAGRIRCSNAASGLTTAIDPILRASGGVWVAHGSGNADREVVDARDRSRFRRRIHPTRCGVSGCPRGLRTNIITVSPTRGFGRCATPHSIGRVSARAIGRATGRRTKCSPMPFWKKRGGSRGGFHPGLPSWRSCRRC